MSVNELFRKANGLSYDQSNGMISVKEMKGPGFFPGCIGTITADNKLEQFPIMVLGQDFDTEANHRDIIKQHGEIEGNKTWTNLRKLLDELSLDANTCFFTNAYMGLRPSVKGIKTKNTGPSPAAKKGGEVFAEKCSGFFKQQLETIQPNLVLVLGKETARFLCNAFPGCFPKWEKVKRVKNFYESDHLFTDLEFGGKTIHFVFVIHPCMNSVNRSRVFKEKASGWEQELLKKFIADKY